MTFIEWFEKNYTWLSGRMVRGRMNEAWDAGAAKERERCLRITQQYTGAVVSLIAEQIRKGE